VIVIVLLRLLPSSCLPNEGMQRKQERKWQQRLIYRCRNSLKRIEI
jgi:hypothetical protein